MTEAGGAPKGRRDGVPIPIEELSEEALRAVVAEFVTRDGTELTDESRKAEQVMALLQSGEAQVWFDPTSRTCNIITAP